MLHNKTQFLYNSCLLDSQYVWQSNVFVFHSKSPVNAFALMYCNCVTHTAQVCKILLTVSKKCKRRGDRLYMWLSHLNIAGGV